MPYEPHKTRVCMSANDSQQDTKEIARTDAWLKRRLKSIFLRFVFVAGVGGASAQAYPQEYDKAKIVEGARKPEKDVPPDEKPQAPPPVAEEPEPPPRELTPEEKEARLREIISLGFQETTAEMMSRNVAYQLGAKGGVESVDCSGFVEKAALNAIGYLKGAEKLYAPREGQESVFDTSARYQIGETARRSGFVIKGVKKVLKADLKEGMLVALNGGERGGWDHGLDHIVLIYRDPGDGQLMVGQSSSGGGGVNTLPLEDWKRRMANFGALEDLQAVDVVKLAQAVGAEPDEEKLAARRKPAVFAEAKPAAPFKL